MLLYAHCLIVSHPNSARASNLVTTMSNTVIVTQISVSMQKKEREELKPKMKLINLLLKLFFQTSHLLVLFL
jgi:hypothetical protein